MFPTFFKLKMKEVKSFLRIMKGKVTENDEERIRGAEEALKNIEEEKKLYQTEKEYSLNGIDPDTKRCQGDSKDFQDISAI